MLDRGYWVRWFSRPYNEQQALRRGRRERERVAKDLYEFWEGPGTPGLVVNSTDDTRAEIVAILAPKGDRGFPRLSSRDMEALRLRDARATFAAIASALGVSCGRARQIVLAARRKMQRFGRRFGKVEALGD